MLDDGRRVAAACLNSPAYRDFCKEWADWVLECGVDSVFWDEPAWVVPAHVGVDDAERWTCRCDRCAERFGGPVPGELTPEVRRFREASVVDFLREVTRSRRGARRLEHDLPAARDRGHAGPRRLERGRCPPGSGDAGDGSVLEALGRGGRPVRAPLRPPAARDGDRHGVGAQLWVPSFGLDRSDIPELEAAVAAAREEGVDDLWTWGYEACRHMTSLATPDAPLVWDAVSAALTAGRRPPRRRLRARISPTSTSARRATSCGCSTTRTRRFRPRSPRRATRSPRRSTRSSSACAAAAGSSTPAPARREPWRRSTRPSAAPPSARHLARSSPWSPRRTRTRTIVRRRRTHCAGFPSGPRIASSPSARVARRRSCLPRSRWRATQARSASRSRAPATARRPRSPSTRLRSWSGPR